MTVQIRQSILLLALLALPSLLEAQANGRISGSVTDASGAAVPSAEVIATNVGTGLKRVLKADSNGQFLIPLLPAGVYEVRVEQPGFTPFVQRNITVQADTAVQVNAALEVQGTSAQITVSDSPTLVQGMATNLVQVVEQRRVADLPLNGRNVLQLMVLNAGITNSGSAGATQQTGMLAGGAYSVPASINGSRGNGTNFMLDNAANNDNYTNVAAPFPNPDAVQEVSVQTSTFDAQFGHGVGGVVSVVTRSGTNELHGSMYDYLRNNAMNAANFFSGLDQMKRNQFGATLGGPVRLGKMYDGRNRTFFFFSYQGTRTHVATPATLGVTPSAALKSGDFSSWLKSDGSGRIKDPLLDSGYFPNNVIPASRINPVAKKILEYYPTSTSSDYTYRYATPTRRTDDDQWMMRGDHAINDRQRLSLRYFMVDYNQPWAVIPGNLLYVSAGNYGHNHNATINHTWVLTPSLLNQFTVGFTRTPSYAVPPSDIQNTNLQSFGANVLTMPNYPTMALSISGWTGVNLGLGYGIVQSTYQIGDVVGWTRGRHNMRFGGEIQRYRMDLLSYYLSGGSFSSTGQLLSDPGKANAGTAMAEFLLGVGESWSQQSVSSWNLYNNYPSVFFQDDIRLSSRLTVNFGVRWEPIFDFREKNGKETTFIAGQHSTRFTNAPAGLLYIGDAGVGSTVVPPDWNNLAPRFGLAYQINAKTVVRSAWGLFYDRYPSIMINRSAQGQPFVRQATLSGNLSLSNPYGSASPLDPTPLIPASDAYYYNYGTWAIPTKDMSAGYMQNWNLVLERQLFSDTLVRAAYVGSKGTKLLNAMEVNAAVYGPGATAANLNARRPYQLISGLQLGMSNGNSSYQALQLTLEKRMRHGISVLGNYTYSKSIDVASYGSVEGNTGGPNPYNLRDNRGRSDFDLRHRLVVSAVVEHPTLKNFGLLLRNVLGGWQSNLIFTAQSGLPLNVVSGVDNALTGVGNNFADYNGGDWKLSGDRSRAEQIAAWFNTSVFKTNAVGTIGTGRRNQLTGPASWNADYSLFKVFRVRERTELQLRGEFFNFFNHTRLGVPNVRVISSTLFGKITSAGEPRILQVALRLRF